MKKNIRLIVAVVLALVVALSSIALIACQQDEHVCNHKCETCGLCTDKECTDKVCENKCQGHGDTPPQPTKHVCEHVCPKCNKCLDPDCKDPVCAAKCAGHDEEVTIIPIKGEVRYDLDVIQGFAKLANVTVTSDQELGIGYIKDFSWDKQSSVTMEVWCNAADDVQGDLVIKVRKTAKIITLTSQIFVDVNGDVLESEAQVPASAEGENAAFVEVNLGQFWLAPGKNVITITPQSTINNFDFSSVIFYSTAEAQLIWNDMHGVSGTAFLGVDEHVTFDGGFKLNRAENCLGVGAYAAASATFPVYSSRQANAKIYIITNSMTMPMGVTDYFDWTINGRRITSGAQLPGSTIDWGNYEITEVGEYIIDGGLNEIKLALSDNILAHGQDYRFYYNLRGIIIDTDANIGFEEQATEAHVCLSVCPVCGGCQNESCNETACQTKCTCAHVCESVCEICGGCKDAECEEEVCATKCDCTTTEYKLNGSNVTIDNQTYSESEDCVGAKWNGSAYEPVTITYKLTASAACKVKLYFTVSQNPTARKLVGETYDVTINGQAIASDAMYVAGAPWTAYDTVFIGTYELVAGENTIVIVYAHADNQAGATLNFRSISLTHSAATEITFASRAALTNVEIEQNPDKTEYGADEVFDATGLKLKLTYADGTTRVIGEGFTYSEDPLTEGTTTITVSYTEGEVTKTVDVTITVTDPKTKYVLNGNDYRVELSEAWVVQSNVVDNAALNTNNTITYKLVANKARKAGFYMAITTWDSDKGCLTDVYRVTVNGVAVSGTARTPIGAWWGAAVEQYVCDIDLVAGENVIVITYNPADWMTLNFSHIALYTAAEVTFADKTATLTGLDFAKNSDGNPMYPTKVSYNAEETFDPTGMRLVATYSDGTTRKLQYGYTYSENPLVEGATSIAVSYTEGEVTKTVEVPITVTDAKTTKEFKLTGDGVTIDGAKYNEEEDQVGAGAWDGSNYADVTITYKFTVSKATSVKLYFTISRSGTAHKIIGEAYDVSINGKAISSDAMYVAGAPWTDYDTIYIGTYDLVEGKNTIQIVYSHGLEFQPGATLNFRSITMEYSATATIEYKSTTEE